MEADKSLEPPLFQQHKDALNVRYQYESITYESETWCLAHLNPFAFKFSLSEELVVDVVVFFSCHCFTRGATKEERDDLEEKYWYIDEYEARVLDPERYALSTQFLPRLIEELEKRHIKSTGKENFMTIEIIEKSGQSVPYVVFFDVFKDLKRKRRLLLTVQSAYVKEDSTNRMKSGKKVNFPVLLRAVYEGRKIKP